MEAKVHKYSEFTAKDLRKAIKELCKVNVPQQYTFAFSEEMRKWLKLYKEKYGYDI